MSNLQWRRHICEQHYTLVHELTRRRRWQTCLFFFLLQCRYMIRAQETTESSPHWQCRRLPIVYDWNHLPKRRRCPSTETRRQQSACFNWSTLYRISLDNFELPPKKHGATDQIPVPPFHTEFCWRPTWSIQQSPALWALLLKPERFVLHQRNQVR